MAKKNPNIAPHDQPVFVAGHRSAFEALWTIATWRGLPLYTCLFCPFDTIDGESAMLEHWQQVHAAPAPVVDPERSIGDDDCC